VYTVYRAGHTLHWEILASIMADTQPRDRLRTLAETAADFSVDSNIPIRRYFRSGNEMIKMAEVYFAENKLEAAYVLYMKYMTLHVEKLIKHRDYAQVLPAEKKKFRLVVKDVMSRTEELKSVLQARYEAEHVQWQMEEAVRIEERRKMELEENRRMEEAAKARAAEEASIEKDRQVAMWHQAQLDAEAGVGSISGLPVPPQVSPGSTGAGSPSFQPHNIYPPTPSSVPPPSYNSLPSAPPPPCSPPCSPPPSYDRCVKPASTLASPPSSSSSCAVPAFDRSVKPVTSTAVPGLRTVVVPGDLMDKFLRIAKDNSNKGIETLGTLGGSLCNDRLVISHLVIPRQTGKGDSCTMEGLEDVWDVHDKENIIFLGWIHTHPEYDVFLSSVDMHNQYEWQHMLPEALAIVCSIKFDQIGFLNLTKEGLAEIGKCDKVDFHPHSKEPPLFEAANHVEVDQGGRVNVKDLRF